MQVGLGCVEQPDPVDRAVADQQFLWGLGAGAPANRAAGQASLMSVAADGLARSPQPAARSS
ncbi:hypothetical protein [Nocardia brasiliensis]|uniref:hypothetical protein n=1 Tax=Nocardia brasiliensis TaxID=37326 RepID=UPI002457149F|nr:hypothetical protein [Nocardia brasiliensis]